LSNGAGCCSVRKSRKERRERSIHERVKQVFELYLSYCGRRVYCEGIRSSIKERKRIYFES
jgi:hypothetical protein